MSKYIEEIVISLLGSYLDIIFDFVYAATDNRYADGNDIRLVNLGPVFYLVVIS